VGFYWEGLYLHIRVNQLEPAVNYIPLSYTQSVQNAKNSFSRKHESVSTVGVYSQQHDAWPMNVTNINPNHDSLLTRFIRTGEPERRCQALHLTFEPINRKAPAESGTGSPIKRSASTIISTVGGCTAFIHPTSYININGILVISVSLTGFRPAFRPALRCRLF
jgi:hypothetical protein